MYIEPVTREKFNTISFVPKYHITHFGKNKDNGLFGIYIEVLSKDQFLTDMKLYEDIKKNYDQNPDDYLDFVYTSVMGFVNIVFD